MTLLPANDSASKTPSLPGDAAPSGSAAVVFAAVFAVFGLHAPYFPVWLASRGLNATELAMAMSLPLLLRPLVTPLVGRIADQRADRRSLVASLAALTAAFAIALTQVAGTTAIIICAAGMMLSYQPVQPVTDATVGSLVRRGLVHNYGRLRIWGSVSFAVVAVLGGWLLHQAGISVVFAGYVALVMLVISVTYWLPSAGGEQRRSIDAPFLLWKRPAMMLVLAAFALITASQAMYFSFGSMHMLRLGYPDWSIGLMWTIGVIAEVVVLWYAPSALIRLGPYGLMFAGAVATSLRWLGMALDPPLWVTGVLQLLHAGTLSCALLALMAFVEQMVEEGATARAQSAAVTITGLLTAAMTLATGPIYQRYGGAAYALAAALPAFAVILLVAGRRRLTSAGLGG